MKYRKLSIREGSLTELADSVDIELSQIEQAFAEQDFVQLVAMTVAPAKPRDGLTVLADGVNWDPGSGQGVYTYYNGAWRKLG